MLRMMHTSSEAGEAKKTDRESCRGKNRDTIRARQDSASVMSVQCKVSVLMLGQFLS
ncbi:Uncharacterized protein DAT39_013609 [Clarias magur]|uniref:Uncharacterized protein n=1 Tax=Clarias magur TaxID=1594786 RepID=A0A8J4TT03_CLAMG|nr:Uncharacterized protein DAT39_013609 [Clarias magur]